MRSPNRTGYDWIDLETEEEIEDDVLDVYGVEKDFHDELRRAKESLPRERYVNVIGSLREILTEALATEDDGNFDLSN